MRWLEPELVTGPTFEPVTLGEAKAAQRIDGNDEDALLLGYLMAARSHIEQVTGLRLATQTLRLRADSFDAAWFRLPAAPVQSVSIQYLDADGVQQTLDPTVYEAILSGLEPMVGLAYGKSWPAHRVHVGAVTVTAVCGYAQGDIPDVLRQAILLVFGEFNARREPMGEGAISPAVAVGIDALTANYRRATF